MKERLDEVNRIKELMGVTLLTEAYGTIQQSDDLCEIKCKRKLAKVGSKGDVVKQIQHILYLNGFNEPFIGGGMDVGCKSRYLSCDGIFDKRTKEAVIQFQKKNGLSQDGIVGPNTYYKMCEVLKFSSTMTKPSFCPTNCGCEKEKVSTAKSDEDCCKKLDCVEKVIREKGNIIEVERCLGVDSIGKPNNQNQIARGHTTRVAKDPTTDIERQYINPEINQGKKS